MTRIEHDLGFVTISVLDGNILVLAARSSQELSLEHALALQQLFQQLADKPLGLVIDKNPSFSLGAELLVKGRELVQNNDIRAVAYYSSTRAGQEAARLEIGILKGLLPVELFDSEDAAVTWVKKQLEH